MKKADGFCEILDFTGKGYSPVVDFESWRVAIINHNSNFNNDSIKKVERHNQTDEVFVLLEGRASLIFASRENPGAGIDHKSVNKQTAKIENITEMKNGKIYNVKKGVFHTISLTADAKVLIVENLDTTTENSEYIDLSLKQTRQLADSLFKEERKS